MISLGKGDFDWIIGNKETISEMFPDNEKIVDAFEKALEAFINKDYQASADFFEPIHKESSEKIFLNGIILNYLNFDIEKAQKYLSMYQEEDKDAVYYYFLARVEEVFKNYFKAFDYIEESLNLKEEWLPSLFRMGYYSSILGDSKQALKYYEKCLKLNPVYVNVLLNLGSLYEDNGQYNKAIEYYKKVLDEFPSHHRALIYLKDAQSSLHMYVDEKKKQEESKQIQILATPISEFELSVRSSNCLSKMNINTLGDLIKKTETELLSFKNFGETSLKEIKEILLAKNLQLGMDKKEDKPYLGLPGSFDMDIRKESMSDIDLGMGSEMDMDSDLDMNTEDDDDSQNSGQPIATLNLTARSSNCLQKLNINTVDELLQKSERELLSCKNFGQVSLHEIRQKLTQAGLSLKE